MIRHLATYLSLVLFGAACGAFVASTWTDTGAQVEAAKLRRELAECRLGKVPKTGSFPGAREGE